MFNFSSGAHLSQANIVLHSVKGAFQILFSRLHDTTLYFTEVSYVVQFLFLYFPICVPSSYRSLYRISYSKLYHIGLKNFFVLLSNHVKHYTA